MSIAMTRPEDYTALARTAEECGFHQVAVPDSSFWSEQVSDDYPYTADGSRMWTESTPFADPFMAVAAMAAVTTRIRFCTHVIKVAVRNPLLLAKQVSTAAVMSGNRFTFGAGIGWLKEEFEWCGQQYAGRGKYTDESLEAIEQILTGEWTSYDGERVQFGKLKMPPAPTAKVPIYIGGHTDIALRRTVRFAEGWTSAMLKTGDFVSVHARLEELLAEAGRDSTGFTYQVASADRFGLEGYKELAALGATDVVTVPWVFYGSGMEDTLEAKQDGIRRFAKDVIDKW